MVISVKYLSVRAIVRFSLKLYTIVVIYYKTFNLITKGDGKNEKELYAY